MKLLLSLVIAGLLSPSFSFAYETSSYQERIDKQLEEGAKLNNEFRMQQIEERLNDMEMQDAF